MSSLTCHTEAKELTVGQVFVVQCQGDLPKAESVAAAAQVFVTPSPSVASTEAKAADGQPVVDSSTAKFQFKILKAELKTPQSVDFQVTSYMVGQHSLSDAKVSMGGQIYDLQGIQFKVNSILDPSAKEPPKPFGPLGPIVLGIPTEVYVFVLVSLFLVLSATFTTIRFFANRVALKKKLKAIESETSAGSEYFLLLRKLRKEYESGKMTASDVMRFIQAGSFRYLSRVFGVWFDSPTWIRAAKDIADMDLKLTKSEKQELSKQVHAFLTEVQKIHGSSYNLAVSELENIFGRALALNEKIEKLQKAEEL